MADRRFCLGLAVATVVEEAQAEEPTEGEEHDGEEDADEVASTPLAAT
jgi:hypothetical protein